MQYVNCSSIKLLHKGGRGRTRTRSTVEMIVGVGQNCKKWFDTGKL